MARKKTRSKTKKKTPTRPAARSRARAKAPRVAPRPRGAAKGAPGSDVERRWKEYWACRTTLEDAVQKVKAARESLQAAQEAERRCRSEFETIKSSLTDLLDVEPAGGPQRQPTAVPQRSGSPQGLPAPQSAGPKPL